MWYEDGGGGCMEADRMTRGGNDDEDDEGDEDDDDDGDDERERDDVEANPLGIQPLRDNAPAEVAAHTR